MSKTVIITLVVIVLAGGLVFWQTSSDDSDAGELEEMPVALITVSVGDLQAHNSETDCWTVVDGNVYDITDYIPRHPGGDEVLRACGADGTSLFNARTTADGEQVGSGTPHSSSAGNQLEDLLIGTYGFQ